jgi:hypothetical protein
VLILRPFIWIRVIGLIRFRDGSVKRKASHFIQISEEVRRRPWQWSDERTRKVQTLRRKKNETDVKQSQDHTHHSLWHQGDCSQRIRSGRPNRRFRILLLRFTTPPPPPSLTSFFTRQFFLKQHDCCSHPPYFSLFSRVKITLKGRHFDTIEAIEVESQVLLNTLTDHVSHVAFKKCQKRWERCIRAERDYLESDGGQ